MCYLLPYQSLTKLPIQGYKESLGIMDVSRSFNRTFHFLVIEESDITNKPQCHAIGLAELLYTYFQETNLSLMVKHIVVLPGVFLPEENSIKHMVLEHAHASDWSYGFMDWIEESCIVCAEP